MPFLKRFTLPLETGGPPTGYSRSDCSISAISNTTSALKAVLKQRDVFLGEYSCVICGERYFTSRCHIIGKSEDDIWDDLKMRNWIPARAGYYPAYEPRNALSLCPNHGKLFNAYYFYIRFCPDSRKFIFINHSQNTDDVKFHGKAVALDSRDRYAPFPALLLIHEMRVRGHHPFRPLDFEVQENVPWQDWVVSRGVFDDASGTFKREKPPRIDKNLSASMPAPKAPTV